jgi:hypothetical protein
MTHCLIVADTIVMIISEDGECRACRVKRRCAWTWRTGSGRVKTKDRYFIAVL